jgi:hypothetical protein
MTDTRKDDRDGERTPRTVPWPPLPPTYPPDPPPGWSNNQCKPPPADPAP